MLTNSKQQFSKMFVLHKQGKISDEQLKEYTDTVDYDSLPNKRKSATAANLLKRKNQE